MKKTARTRNILILGFVGMLLLSCAVPSQPPDQKLQIQPTRPESVSIKPIESQTIVKSSANIYLIALEDNGKSGPVVGCGDSLVEIETQGLDAQAALQLLLDNHKQWYGQSGLYNALYQSDLKIKRFESKAGKLEVDLTGNMLLGGECDNPRVNDQLKATIRQSTTESTQVVIKINGTLLDDLLSQK
jgi:hypothetical protein